MAVLVTGASGFIGKHLVPHLLEAGYEVIALSRQPATMECNGLRWIQGDFTRGDALEQIPGGVDAICHLATAGTRQHRRPGGSFEPRAVEEIIRVNVLGTLGLLHLARLRPIPRFIYTSSMAVYGKPTKVPVTESDGVYPTGEGLTYAASKLVGELYCHQFMQSYGLPCSILRLSYVYGLGMPEDQAIPIFMKQAATNGSLRIHGSGDETWDFLYVKDAVQGILKAYQSQKSGVFNIGTGAETSLKTLAQAVLESFPQTRSTIDIGNPGQGLAPRFYMDISKAREQLGFEVHDP
ncbi:MAG: NAD(P)-dependent oxidoreductase, partial [Chloroflexi bacterium]|nr:NAD(P)-dependent oxidoreductase [Chloroflexota bacterium]